MYLKTLWKMEYLHLGANALFSIIFSKVLKALLNYFFIFFSMFV